MATQLPQQLPLAQLPQLMWQSCDGMMVIDSTRRIVAMNPTLQRWTGFSAEAAASASCVSVFDCQDLDGCPMVACPQACPGLRAIQEASAVACAEYAIRTVSGGRRIVSSSYTPIPSDGDVSALTLVVMRDVTRQKRREQMLAKQALLDPLTAVPNRAALMESLRCAIKHASRYHRPLAVAMADLDGLKQYNDKHGHAAGDSLLKAVAAVLRSHRREEEVVARYGGDEFVILLPEADAVSAISAAERLRKAVERFSPAAGITISIGVAVYPSDGRAPELLLAAADRRLYEGKRLGRNCVIGPSHQRERREQPRVVLEAPLRLRLLGAESADISPAGAIKNISLGGCYAVLPQWTCFEPGDELALSARIPGQYQDRFPVSRLIGRGRVVRVERLLSESRLPQAVGMALTFGDDLLMFAALPSV